MQQHFFRLNIIKRAHPSLAVMLCLSLLRSSYACAPSAAVPASFALAFNTQSLAQAPQAFTWQPLTRGWVRGLGGLLRRAEIPVYWLFKGQKPTPLFYRVAHLFSETWISRRTAVIIGFFGIAVESLGLLGLIHQNRSMATVLMIATAGALLHGSLRVFDRDPDRRRLPVHYMAAQFASLAIYGGMILSPLPTALSVTLYLYAQLQHFAPKWHPTSGAEARIYAADLEKDKKGNPIDFINKIFVPTTIRQWWAYVHLMNVPVQSLLDDLETFDQTTREYHLTYIALSLNHRYLDFPLLDRRYQEWTLRNFNSDKAKDLISLMLSMGYIANLQKQDAQGNVRSQFVNKRAYRNRYPEAIQYLSATLEHFRSRGELDTLRVQEYAISNGNTVLDTLDALRGQVKNVDIDASDNTLFFPIVNGLFKHGRYANYTFIFNSLGELIHAYSSVEGRFWMRWMLILYMPPKLRRKLKYLVSFMTGIQHGEWRIHTQKIEARWKQFKHDQNTSPWVAQVQITQVSNVRPDLVQYSKETNQDPRVNIREADVFKDPQKTPARSKHVIMVNGLLPRTNEYFGPDKIKNALSQMGRNLVEGGILINATRGSLYYPTKLYMDVYKRIGNNLLLIHTEGYSEAEWQEKENWHVDERWRNRYWWVIPVASDPSDESAAHAFPLSGVMPGSHHPQSDGIRPLLLRA
jgi:hypothetical protein